MYTNWFSTLFTDKAFEDRVKARWTELSGYFSEKSHELICEGASEVRGRVEADFAAYGETPEYRNVNINGRKPLPFEDEVKLLDRFMRARILWLDSQWFTGDALYGDVDKDHNLNIVDVVYMAKIVHRHGFNSMEYSPEADLNGDGVVNAIDLALLKYLVLNV
jgi:hypothetical protein